MYLTFMGFVEARNTIMHGLGELTRKQSRSPELLKRTASRLGHAHLVLDGSRLVLDSTAVDEAVTASVDLVKWLDIRVGGRGVIGLR